MAQGSSSKKSATEINQEGLKLFEQKKFEEALKCFQTAAQMDPYDSSYAKNLGETFFRLGKLDQAISNYRRAIWLNNNRADYYNDLGSVYVEQEDHYNALKLFQTASQLDETKRDYQENLAKEMRKIGEYYQSIRIYQKLLRRFPKDSKIYNNIGICFFQIHDFNQAYYYFQLSNSLSPENITYLQNMADALRQMNKNAEAIDLYQKILKINPKDDLSWNFLGVAYLQTKNSADIELAKKALKQATLLNPENGVFWTNLGMAYRTAKNYASAIQAYKKAAELSPDNYLIQNNLSICFYLKGDLPTAKFHNIEAIRLKPNDPMLIENVIQILVELREWQEAYPYFENLRDLRPFDAYFNNSFGKCLMNLDRLIEAELHLKLALKESKKVEYYRDLLELYEKANNLTAMEIIIKETEENNVITVQLYNIVGKAFVKQKNFQQSHIYYEKAFNLETKNENSIFNLALSFYRITNFQSAVEYLTKYLEIIPFNSDFLLLRSKCYAKLKEEEKSESDKQRALEINSNILDIDLEKVYELV